MRLIPYFMNERVVELLVKLPAWTEARIDRTLIYQTHSEKMSFVLDLLAAHIEHETGYPFAAAIFDKEHKVVAVGVNNSVLLNNSTAHAEMLALQFAEARLEKPYLPKSGGYTLAASAQPCVMCSGAIYNSGVRELVIGASESDVQELMGFGAGPLHPQWREFFAAKKIAVIEDVEKDRARALLSEYQKTSASGRRATHNRRQQLDAPPGASFPRTW